MPSDTPTIIEGNVHINGTLSAKAFTPPASSVKNTNVEPNAGIDPTKLGHQTRAPFSQENTAAAEGNARTSATLPAKALTPPAPSGKNTNVEPNAGIDPTKLGHQHRAPFSQENTAAAAETKVIYVVYGATATIIAFKVGSIAP